ncbi:MAG: DUF72 domain-containing protein [Chloroflexota bacterium]
MAFRVGTSGWVYNHWRGIFYPEGLASRQWLTHYAQTFESVEINNSFYRLPQAETFTKWWEQAPHGFLFAVKANRFITHMKKLKDPERPLAEFFERASCLGEKLGPILYQLPPHWGLDLRRLESFLAALPAGHVHVMEFREPSWFSGEVFHLMERYDAVHCIHDMRPLRVPLRVTAPSVYLRFHGDPLHGGNYPKSQLMVWAERIERWLGEGLDVYAYFNNDIGGFALENARTLRDAVRGGAGRAGSTSGDAAGL